MTLDEIKRRINDIESVKNDDAIAHEMEDKLYFDFIKYVAGGDGWGLEEKAYLISKTKEIDFARWVS